MTTATINVTKHDLDTTEYAGCACKFVPIDDSRGIKFYTSAKERDQVMAHQKLGAMFGFAPKVYETFDLPHIGEYGFVVERVRIAKYFLPTKYRGRPSSDRYSGYEENYRYNQDVYALIRKVSERLGFYMADPHRNNIGFTDDGRMVLVDWGVESQGLQQ